MKLTSLEIKNFRNFEHIKLEMDKSVTVLVGINGSGKTSIIEAIAISLGTIFSAFDGLKGLCIKKSDARVKSYSLGDTDDVQYQYPVVIVGNGTVEDREITWVRSLNSPAGSTTIKDSKELIDYFKSIQEKIRKGDSETLLPLVAYYGTGRLWDYHREKKSNVFRVNSRLNGYVDSLDGTANVKLMVNWFQKEVVTKYQNREIGLLQKRPMDVVCNALEKYYQLVSGNDHVKIQYNININELEVTYRDEYDAVMRLPLNQMSDGYKSTLSLIADIAYRMSVLNPQLKDKVLEETKGIILIDEIDLHLHPKWQQRIIKDLQSIFPKVQFIVSTHSPSVLHTVSREHIRIIDNNGIDAAGAETYGKDVNSIIRIMGAYERPEEILDAIRSFYQYMNEKNFKEAETILDRLDGTIGDDPLLTSLRVQLEFELM